MGVAVAAHSGSYAMPIDWPEGGSVVRMTVLAEAWNEFCLLPFPDSGKALQIGAADAVAYDSHMGGWVSRVAGEGTPLSEAEAMGLRANRDEVAEALPAMPDDARRYFEHLIRLADLALDQHSHRP